MSTTAASRQAAPAEHPVMTAFSVEVRRNQIVQAVGLAMVSLMGLSVLPWPPVLAWTVAAAATVAAEDRVLSSIAARGEAVGPASVWPPALRVLATILYAVAAFALIAFGGAAARLFAFALMSASMVHVLMRYYRSPLVLIASLTPYLFVLGVVCIGLVRVQLRQGHLIAALAPLLTIAMFAVQLWSARLQLLAVWGALMSEREAAEQRERAADAANRAKSQFLATMSHELRTPLNGVIGMAQALAGDRLGRVQRERVAIIRQSGEALLAVLSNLLDLCRIESGALELEIAEFDLQELAAGVVATSRMMAEEKGLSFTFAIAEAAKGRFLGDSTRIRRILYCLSDNAVKFTNEGGVTLDVDRVDEEIIFRVDDTGIGIGRDDQQRLFERFFQADPSLSRRHGGTGVGLSVCRDLATLMGGVVEASSDLGAGSTFTVRLPLQPAPVHQARREPQGAEAPGELRVLAAEDNATNQIVLKTLLAAAGVEPTLVENGREALLAWEGQTWDIILMDIQMPEMNGVEATQAIRLRESKTGRTRTPIVAVTANAMVEQLSEYEAAGMDAVVAKPIEMAVLLSAMEQALARVDAGSSAPLPMTAS